MVGQVGHLLYHQDSFWRFIDERERTAEYAVDTSILKRTNCFVPYPGHASVHKECLNIYSEVFLSSLVELKEHHI